MPSPTSSNKPRADTPLVRPRHWEFEAIGTWWRIDLYQNMPDDDNTRLESDIKQRIEEFDRAYSRFRPDSLIAQMSRQAGSYTLPEDAKPLLDIYQSLYGLTEGAMTPLAGNLLEDAGYDADYSLQPGFLRAVPAWPDVLDYAFPTLTLRQPVTLDFGAAGKGYLVDLVSDMLSQADISSYCVDAGGDIRQRGIAPDDDRIGLENPLQPDQVIGVASIGDRSLCGSAGNRRSWGGQGEDGKPAFHHIMNPHQRQPVKDIAGLWVVADNALTADALATALFFTSPERLLASYDFEYTILYDRPTGLSLVHSTAFPATLFTR